MSGRGGQGAGGGDLSLPGRYYWQSLKKVKNEGGARFKQVHRTSVTKSISTKRVQADVVECERRRRVALTSKAEVKYKGLFVEGGAEVGGEFNSMDAMYSKAMTGGEHAVSEEVCEEWIEEIEVPPGATMSLWQLFYQGPGFTGPLRNTMILPGDEKPDPIHWVVVVRFEMYTAPVPEVLESGMYKIRNVKWKGPLFCGDGTDDHDDHHVWVEEGADYEREGKELWRVEKQGDGFYKLFSVRHGGPLFCGDGTDDDWGDHFVWVGTRWADGGKELWKIERQSDGTFKIFNKKWVGPLFCGDGKDKWDDHRVWVEKAPGYENGNKERWVFERVGAPIAG